MNILSEKNIKAHHDALENRAPPDAGSGTIVIEIIGAISGLGIAGVLIEWIKQKTNRVVRITKDDLKTEIITKGYSIEDVNKILKNQYHITLKENDKIDNESDI